jgi:hypothetical protein
MNMMLLFKLLYHISKSKYTISVIQSQSDQKVTLTINIHKFKSHYVKLLPSDGDS